MARDAAQTLMALLRDTTALFCQEEALAQDGHLQVPTPSDLRVLITAPLTPTSQGPSRSAMRTPDELAYEQQLRDQELNSCPSSSYVRDASGTSARLRGSLVDWQVEVAWQLALSSDALFLGVQLMDRYLSEARVTGPRLQLLALACLWVAAKYEEAGAAPRAAAFLSVVHGQYSAAELAGMERDVLAALSHRLSLPSAKTFLRRLMYRLAAVDRPLYFLCSYLAELSLLDHTLLRVLPSQVAAAAYVWALVLLGRRFDAAHVLELTHYPLGALLAAIQGVAAAHAAAQAAMTPCTVSLKYMGADYASAAYVPCLGLAELAALPQQLRAGAGDAGGAEAQTLAAAPMTHAAGPVAVGMCAAVQVVGAPLPLPCC